MNLFSLPSPLPREERFDDLLPDRGVKIERIVSVGHATPAGHWYAQERDEWVLVLQGAAVLEYADGRTATLEAGDHVLIPAHERHRVASTSSDPPTIWLAVHGKLL